MSSLGHDMSVDMVAANDLHRGSYRSGRPCDSKQRRSLFSNAQRFLVGWLARDSMHRTSFSPLCCEWPKLEGPHRHPPTRLFLDHSTSRRPGVLDAAAACCCYTCVTTILSIIIDSSFLLLLVALLLCLLSLPFFGDCFYNDSESEWMSVLPRSRTTMRSFNSGLGLLSRLLGDIRQV